jgi:hypothetical protein
MVETSGMYPRPRFCPAFQIEAGIILALVGLLSGAVHAQEIVIGVNVVNPMRAGVADQNARREGLLGYDLKE